MRGFRLRAFRPLILDRYIFREFFLSFFAVMAFCALLLLVSEIFDKFQDIMENNTTFEVAAQYFAANVPINLMQVVPMACMLAVLFSVGMLARNNEILAFMTNGVHVLRIAAPVIFGGFLIFIGYMVVNETVIPPLQEFSRLLENRLEGKTESKMVTQKNVFARGKNNRFYIMRSYNSRDRTMTLPHIVDLSSDLTTLRGRIEASSARLVRNIPEENKSEWIFTRSRFWKFDDAGKLENFWQEPGEVKLVLEEDLPTILATKRLPEEMNYVELRQHIRILEERNQPVHEYRTDLVQKITFPLGILLVMVIGFSYAARSRAGTAMAAFGYGILWAFIYYGLNALLRALGHSGSVSPLVAGILPVLVFLAASMHYLRRSYRWYS